MKQATRRRRPGLRVVGEWGKINAGQRYTAVVYDVGTALACANLRDYEAILIDRIKIDSWSSGRLEGLPDPKPCYVNIRELAKLLGCSEQRLYGAKYRLLKAKLITDDDGRLAINKEAHEWVDPDHPDRPLLSPERLAYARSMRKSTDPERPRKAKKSTHAINAKELNADALNAGELNANEVMHLTHPRYTPNADELMHLTQMSEVPTIEERARDLDELEIEEEVRESAPAGPEPFDSEATDLLPEITGPGKDSPEGRRLVEWARTLGTDTQGEPYHDWVAMTLPHAPAEWIRSILERKVVDPGQRPSIKLLGKIMGDWRRARKPEWPIGIGGANSVPARPANRTDNLKAGIQRMREERHRKAEGTS